MSNLFQADDLLSKDFQDNICQRNSALAFKSLKYTSDQGYQLEVFKISKFMRNYMIYKSKLMLNYIIMTHFIIHNYTSITSHLL